MELEVNRDSLLDNLTLEVDYDGDGVNDVSYDTEGVKEGEVTYDDLIILIKDLDLQKFTEKLLLRTTKSAQKFHKKSLSKIKYLKLEKITLQLLLKQVKLYERLQFISSEQSEKLKELINSLLNN